MADQKRSGGVSVGSIKAGGEIKIGDITSGDKNTLENVSGSAIAISGNAQVGMDSQAETHDLLTILTEWQTAIETKIEAQTQLVSEDKADLREQIDKIKDQILKLETQESGDKEAKLGRLERLINTLGEMSGDILEVVITTLTNPLAGLGLVMKKIGDRVKLEHSSEIT